LNLELILFLAISAFDYFGEMGFNIPLSSNDVSAGSVKCRGPFQFVGGAVYLTWSHQPKQLPPTRGPPLRVPGGVVGEGLVG